MRLSIVTPSLNRVGMIADALASVRDQGVDGVEHLVIDGGSSDGTPELVRREFPHVRLVVEPDRNLYCAINKGVRLASGDVIGFLNTDDRLLPGSLAAVRDCFARNPGAAAACGGCELRARDGAVPDSVLAIYDEPAMKRLRAGDIISGLTLTNGRFFRDSVLETLGGFREDIPVLADREFLARFFLAGYETAAIDGPIYAYGVHRGSLTFGENVVPSHLTELTRLTRQAMAATTESRARAFYRRWHGWASGYEIAWAVRQGRGKQAIELAVRATKADALWPARLLRHAVWHAATRHERA